MPEAPSGCEAPASTLCFRACSRSPKAMGRVIKVDSPLSVSCTYSAALQETMMRFNGVEIEMRDKVP
jgi:hypothetical protein